MKGLITFSPQITNLKNNIEKYIILEEIEVELHGRVRFYKKIIRRGREKL